MPDLERFRERVSELPSESRMAEREKEGWKLIALEWARTDSSETKRALKTEIPFGLQVSEDCYHLEENPIERQTLEMMLDLIVKDQSVSAVAQSLNERGLLTRQGTAWTQIDIFEMLPRIIEVAPDVRWVRAALT